jgi:hypothetical protein
MPEKQLAGYNFGKEKTQEHPGGILLCFCSGVLVARISSD